jgi:hypothetical protein
MHRTLAREGLFEGLMRQFKRRFGSVVEAFESEVLCTIAAHLDAIKETLDMIRSDNVASESEQDPGFRHRVDVQARVVREEISRIQDVVRY